MKSIYICAGGTGGHVFPAVAVFEKIRKDVKFITDERGIKYTLSCVQKNQVILLKTMKLKISCIINMLYNFVTIFVCFWKNKPSHVVCFGGIITVIPALLAKLFGAKIIIHEQNAVMGKANRLIKFFADEVLLAYEQTKYSKYGTYVGVPVRASVKTSEYSLSGKFVLFIVGGSQGSHFFAKSMCSVIEQLPKEILSNIQIFHQVRYDDVKTVQLCYEKHHIDFITATFFHNIFDIYAKANLIIARAGATTLAEIAIAQRPAILIPLKSSADNHQYENAKFYEDKGTCILINEDSDCVQKIRDILLDFIKNKNKLLQYQCSFNNLHIKRSEDLILNKIEEL